MSVNIFQNNALKKIAGNYAIDSSLSTTSDNAVQNKVVTSAINDINSKVGTGTLDVGSDCVSGINTLNTQLTALDNSIDLFGVPKIAFSKPNDNSYLDIMVYVDVATDVYYMFRIFTNVGSFQMYIHQNGTYTQLWQK